MKIPILSILAFTCVNVFAQIKIVSIQKDASNKATYDSTKNFVENAYEYLGQSLFLKPQSERLRIYGYDNFNRIKNGLEIKSDKRIPHDEIQGKTFLVQDVHDGPSSNSYYLTLIESEGLDTLVFSFDSKYEHSFPFIVDGYYKKLLKDYVGQKYVSRYEKLGNFNDGPIPKDIVGDTIENKVGSVWKITDFVLEDEYYSLRLILENASGQQYSTSGQDILLGHHFFFAPLDACNKLKAKYGNQLYTKALKGTVQTGMTKELCEFAWGKPSDVNSTTGVTNSEQWVYDGSYLYFTNGKLTTIQN